MLRALYVDFNSYFAAVEQQVRPELRGRPVAVVPMLADTTCAIAASIEAKRFGVKTLTNVADARRLCPAIEFVVSRPRLYVEFHERARTIIEACAPIAGVNSIDEMWIRLTGRDRERDNALRLAQEIKFRLRHALGEVITCSIGIAPNAFLAKTASDMQKPDGLVVLDEPDFRSRLATLALKDFCGIGPKMLARLADHGITTTAALLSAPPEQLREVWGGIEGERFWQKLHGEDIEPRQTQPASISHSHVLAPERRSHAHAAAVLSRLTQKAAMRLRDAGYLAGGVGVTIKMRGGERFRAHERIEPTDRTPHLLAAVERLLAQLALDRGFRAGAPLGVGMALAALVPAQAVPRALFDDDAHGEALDRTVDRLNLKFGNQTLFWGSAFAARSDGRMAIAFNHIPDLATEDDGRTKHPARGRRSPEKGRRPPNTRRGV